MLPFLCGANLEAGVIPSVAQPVRTTNYTGFLIAADSVTWRVPDRSQLMGEWSVGVTWDGLDTTGANVESTLWLEDDLGALVPFQVNGTGAVVTEFVELDQFSLNAGNPTQQRVFSISLVPASRLQAQRRYELKAKYRVQPGGGQYGAFVNVPAHASAVNTAVYHHFTNTVSADAGANASTQVSVNSWPRSWMIAGSATQGNMRVMVDVVTFRFDGFDEAPVSQAILSELTVALKREATGQTVWTAPARQISLSVPSHTGGTGAAADPAFTLGQTVVDLAVPAGVLVPGERYLPEVAVSHSGEVGGAANDGAREFQAQRLLRLSGRVFFGSVAAAFDEVTNDPVEDLQSDAVPLPTSTLAVAAGHGTLPDAPGAGFGGVALAVQIEQDGDAVYGDGTQIPVTGGGTVSVNGTSIERGSMVLTTAGARAGSLTVRLPRGLGYATMTGTRVLKSQMSATNVALQSNLLPTHVTLAGTVYVSLERLPLVFGANGLTFDMTAGRFLFTPTSVAYNGFLELGVLEGFAAANQLDWDPAVPLHAGNDQVFRHATVSGTHEVRVSTGGDGAAFVHALELGFSPSAWWTHFPKHWLVTTSGAFTQASVFRITEDVVDQNSRLEGVDAVYAWFTPDPPLEEGKPECPFPAPAKGPRFFMLTNAQRDMNFLADGSLDAAMTAQDNMQPGPPYPALSSVGWGTFATAPDKFAHGLTFTFGQGLPGNVMLPAHFLPWRGAEVSALPMAKRAAAAHLSGRGMGVGGTQVEHPHEVSYQEGAADYAGFNVRRSTAGAGLLGYSALGGGTAVGYSLLAETKMYLRPGGASGRVNSADSLAMLVNGFPLQLDGIKLAFLDNAVVDTRLDGGVAIGDVENPVNPQPCLFNVAFRNLRLWSNGALNTGEVDPAQGDKYLNYWRSTITPLSMDFVQPDACAGAGGETWLALGVETALPALTAAKKLTGVLGFKPNGLLVNRAEQSEAQFAVTGLDSRLRPPGSIQLQGPGSSHFSVTPVSGIYLNHWSLGGSTPAEGFASLAGAVDVPFFENLIAHLHCTASATAGQNPLIHVMQPPENLGPFTLAGFDPENSGLPAGVGLSTYRNGSAFYPWARKDWLGLVQFAYPLRWNAALRQFEMLAGADVTTDLTLLDVKSRVRALTPTTADVKFKADIGPVNLPSLDAGQLLGEAVTGAGGTVLAAIGSALPDFSSAMTELAAFEQCLADTPALLVQVPLSASVARVRAALAASASAAQFKAALVADLLAAFHASPGVPGGQGWKLEVKTRLDALDALLLKARGYAESGSALLQMAQAARSILGGAEVPSEIPSSVKERLSLASGILGAARARLGTVRSGINAIGQPGQELVTDWASIVELALLDLPAQPLSVDDAVISSGVLDHFLGDASSARLSEQMRIHLSDMREQTRGALDAVFSGVNEMLQEGLGSPAVPQAVANLAEIKLGRIDGHARINGDSLHELHLDAALNLALGTELDFQGWLTFRDLESDTPVGACRTSAGITSEVLLGAATEFPMGVPASPARLEIEGKFAFDENAALNGLAGRFGIAGQGIQLGVLTLQQAELGFGFGGGDAYLYGKGAGVSDYADVEAALFVGKACEITSVMTRVDPMVAELFAQPQVGALVQGGNPSSVFGFYAFGYGSISVNALLGIPPSCMLNLKAGAGIGGFYFARDTGLVPKYQAVVGLRQDMGVSGEILCLADVSARLSLVGALPTGGDSLLDTLSNPAGTVVGNGKAKVSLTVGASPFDVTISKTLKMNFAYKPLKFGLDF